MAWIKTSETCSSIYGALGDLKQFDNMATFDAVGPLKMQDLTFYDVLASAAINNANALARATSLDSSLIGDYDGSYKSGFNSGNAIVALTAVMQIATKVVEDLSDTADNIYSF